MNEAMREAEKEQAENEKAIFKEIRNLDSATKREISGVFVLLLIGSNVTHKPKENTK